MSAAIVARSKTSFTVQVEIPYGSSTLDSEQVIQERLNQASALATHEALQRFGTDGSPVKPGSGKFASVGELPEAYQANRTGVNSLRRYWPASVAVLAFAAGASLAWAVSKDRNSANSYVSEGMALVARGRLAEARPVFEKALAIDPKHYPAFQGLASVAFLQGDLESNQSYLSKAIEAAESRSATVPSQNIAALYWMRADNSIRLGDKIRSSVPAHKFRVDNAGQSGAAPDLPQLPINVFQAALPHYKAAKQDIDRAFEFYQKLDSEGRFKVNHVAAWVEVALGDVAARFENFEDSVAHFTQANHYLQQALGLKLTPFQQDKLRTLDKQTAELRHRTDTRLQIDGSKLKEQQRLRDAMAPQGTRTSSVP